MERNSGVRASEHLKLPDRFGEVIVFEFELVCTTRLKIYDDEQQARMLEMLGMGSLGAGLSTEPPVNRGGAAVIEAGWQV